MGSIVSKKKVNLDSVAVAINKAFINFAYYNDPTATDALQVKPNQGNIVPTLFETGTPVDYSFSVIDNQFDNETLFYNFVYAEMLNLAQNETTSFLGFVSCPPSFANVSIDINALRDAVNEMYYLYNDECSIVNDNTLMDFNQDGTYNHVNTVSANQVMNSFATCQTTESRQNETNQTLSNKIDGVTTVSTSTWAWVFLIGMILIFLLVIVAIIIGIVIFSKQPKKENYEVMIEQKDRERQMMQQQQENMPY